MSTYVVTLVIEDLDPTQSGPDDWNWKEILDHPGAVMVSVAEEIESHPTAEQVDLLQRLTSDYRRAIAEMRPLEEDDDPEVCSECGSDNLMWDAYVDANGEVVSTFDSVNCGACGGPARAIPLSDFEESEEEN